MARKTRLKANASEKKAKSRNRDDTDWSKLRRMSVSSVRRGIAADPDAHATDENFWKSAKVVLPAR
jgi:hypothetical protein